MMALLYDIDDKRLTMIRKINSKYKHYSLRRAKGLMTSGRG